MDPAGGTNYLNMGSTQLQNVPFAYYSYGVNAANVNGILPITSGGTGASSLNSLKSNLEIDLVNNVLDVDKPVSKATQIALDAKAPLASPTFTGNVGGITKVMVGLSAVDNTSDLSKPISTLTQAALDLKVSSATFSTTLHTKVSAETFSTSIVLKENTGNKSTATDLGAGTTSDILFPTQKAVKTYVDAQINSGGVADGGIITAKLADAAVTNAKLATGIDKAKVGLGNVDNIALSTWQGSSNLNILGTITTGTWSGSAIDFNRLSIQKDHLTTLGLVGDDEFVIYNTGNGIQAETNVSQNATRRSGSPIVTTTFSIPDNGITSSMIPDGEITDAKLANGISKSKIGLGNVENSALSSWTGNSLISTVGTIHSGTWSGSVISVNNGGTGASNAADARRNLGLEIGTNVQAFISPGIDYVIPTGNVSTANLAGNITATSNSTLLSLPNLNSVGTISSGIWSGTAVSLTKGGTGASNAVDARRNLGLEIGVNVHASMTAGLDYVVPAGNVATATKLANTKNINGVPFDGSADITIGIDASSISGTVSVSKGGSGTSSFTANNLLIGNGVNPIQTLAPGLSGQVLSSNGTNWTSSSISNIINAGTLSGSTLSSNVVNSSLTSVGILNSATINGKVIVGATSSVSTSAILEANSTTKGFLPPRMSAQQRDAIESPASGLTIWCNNCGRTGELQVYGENEEWLTLTGQTVTGVYTPTVGENYQGGIVAYILVEGDFGYDPNVPHGLIASKTDANDGGDIRFWNDQDRPINYSLNSYDVGYGYANTIGIINSFGEVTISYAAGLANAYRGGGYADWYLPSIRELEKLYLAKTSIGEFTIGGYYWSSTYYGRSVVDYFIALEFASNQSYRRQPHPSLAYRVRPVRSF
jgi:hypothetical protein